MIILEAVNLKKNYLRDLPLYKQILLPFSRRQQVKALDSVSICIEAGEILGVVGPNGAGKTTLLRILADLLEADTGTIRICGQMSAKNNFRIRSRIGYVSSDERSFFWRLTGRENLEFFAKLYGLSYGQTKQRTTQLINDFGFENKSDQLFRDYSAGMRKKVSVMRALLHEPSLLLLDEVTNGLDPGSAKLVRKMVRQYVSTRKGCAAVWSTHRLEEISQLCDTVIMIDSGRIVGGGFAKDFSDDGNLLSDYLLKTKNLNGQFEALYQKITCKAKVQTNLKDNSNEFVLSKITQEQFGKIVSLAVKDYGAHILFAGCIKKDPDMLFDKFSGEYLCDSCS